MKTIYKWKFQHDKRKFWTMDLPFLLSQLVTRNHSELQAFDEKGIRITNTVGITFKIQWDFDAINPELINVPQVITGTPINLPTGVTYAEAPIIEIWLLNYVPAVGEEPWIVAPPVPGEEPPKPFTAVYPDMFLNPGYFTIEGEAGSRTIKLPHLKPVYFPTLSTIEEGVTVKVDINQRVIQIDTEPFEGKKTLCKLGIGGTSGYEQPKFSYVRPWTKPKGQVVHVYEIADNDVPILFAFPEKKLKNYTVAQWNQMVDLYAASRNKELEATYMSPPIEIISPSYTPDILFSIQPRLIKVALGSQWDDVQYPNPYYDTPYGQAHPILTKPGVKRAYESLGARVFFYSNLEEFISIQAVTKGNFNGDVPGIYQPVVSVSFPDWPNPLGLIYKTWIVVLNEDGTDPPGVNEFYKVNSFETMELTVHKDYPSELLRELFAGKNASFAQKGYFVTDYKRGSCPINWAGVEFPTDQVGIFEITGTWVPRYAWIEPDVLANPPKVILHIV